jgi:hypothetical protein
MLTHPQVAYNYGSRPNLCCYPPQEHDSISPAHRTTSTSNSTTSLFVLDTLSSTEAVDWPCPILLLLRWPPSTPIHIPNVPPFVPPMFTPPRMFVAPLNESYSPPALSYSCLCQCGSSAMLAVPVVQQPLNSSRETLLCVMEAAQKRPNL